MDCVDTSSALQRVFNRYGYEYSIATSIQSLDTAEKVHNVGVKMGVQVVNRVQQVMNKITGNVGGIDESLLPAADLQKKSTKKGLSVPDAFAGLLVFDMLCLSAVRYMYPEKTFAKVATKIGLAD